MKGQENMYLIALKCAALSVDVLPLLEEEAKERQRQQAIINSPFTSKVEIVPPLKQAQPVTTATNNTRSYASAIPAFIPSTSSQRAAQGMDLLPILEEEARERTALSKTNGKSREQAATMLQTNSKYVQNFKVTGVAMWLMNC